MTGMMKSKNVATLDELIAAAQQLKIKFIACEMAMHILGLKKEDLIDDVQEVIGVPTFLKYSEDAQVLFI
jgi:peroxiredoxin family protein